MNKGVIKLCAIVTVVLGFAPTGNASLQLAIGDAYYVGNVIKGAPANPLSDVSYINTLTTLVIGQSNTTIGSQKYNRLGSTHPGPFGTAFTTDSIKVNNINTFDLGSMTYQYILAKNGNIGSFVWYNAAGFTGEIQVPSDLNGSTPGGGLSHVTAYKGTAVIPEPATLIVWTLLIGSVSLIATRRGRCDLS